MFLTIVDYAVACITLFWGTRWLLADQPRTFFVKFYTTSIVWYVQGLIKMLLIMFAFFTGVDDVISIPMLVLTFVYALGTIVFIPILSIYMAEVDAQHTILITNQKDKYR